MIRETIKIADYATNVKYPNMKNLHMDDWDNCNLIEDKLLSFNGEKGCSTHECIIERLSDGKFFKFEYTDWGKGETDIKEQLAKEVFKEEQVITIISYK